MSDQEKPGRLERLENSVIARLGPLVDRGSRLHAALASHVGAESARFFLSLLASVLIVAVVAALVLLGRPLNDLIVRGLEWLVGLVYPPR